MQASEIAFKKDPPSVALHPLVIINVSDHYTRIRANSGIKNPFVFGALMGTREGSKVEIFDGFECIMMEGSEDQVDIALTNERLALTQDCFQKLGIEYEMLGWYCTGSDVGDKHLSIHKQFLQLSDGDASIMMVLDAVAAAQAKRDLPIYLCEHEAKLREDGTSSYSFGRIPFKVETGDAERVSVDHVAHARQHDGGSQTVAHLSRVRSATTMLSERVQHVIRYVKAVQDGSVPVDHEMLRQIKALCHMLPAMDTTEFRSEALTEYNDNLLQIYLAALMKSTNKLNDLVDHYNVTSDRGGRMRFPGMGMDR